MSKREISKFLVQGTLTGKLATVKKDGSPHVVPIWFTVDDDNNRKGDIIFTTNSISVKAKNIQRNNRVSICIDDQTPPFSFITIYGIAISSSEPIRYVNIFGNILMIILSCCRQFVNISKLILTYINLY